MRTCLQTGQWSGEQPTCQRMCLCCTTLAAVYGCCFHVNTYCIDPTTSGRVLLIDGFANICKL